MSPSKEQRRQEIIDEYKGTSGRPPVQRCSNCAIPSEKMMQIGDKMLCKTCLIDEMDKADTEINDTSLTRIYYLMERLKTTEKRFSAGVISNIWGTIVVNSIVVNRGRKENFYHINLNNGEIILNETESLNCTKFRIEFQRIYGILLPNLPNTQWACLLTEWLISREQGKDVEEISEHQEVIDSVLENLTSSRLIKGIGASIFGTVYYHDDAILVPNETIKNIVGKINRNLTLRKASNIMSPYLIGTTKTYRTIDGVIRMWRFDPKKIGINIDEALDLDVGGNEDE